MRHVIEQAEGPDVHIWTQGEGVWACCAYDHGPLCRLCQRVTDDVFSGMLMNVREGKVTCRAKSDGEFEFKLTAKGEAAAEQLIHGTVEGAALWGEIQRDLGSDVG